MNLQRAVQSFLHKFISDESSLIAQKSVHIISELYRKRIWTDAKTVNIIASAIYNSNNTVFIAAIHFFLGIDIKMLEDEEENQQSVKKQKMDINLHEHSKKTRKRERQVEKQRNKITKLQKKLSEKNNTDSIHSAKPLLPAIVMINNPNQLADHLYKKLKAGNKHAEKFETKLLIMNFLSQLIGCHKLILLHFYSFLQKYITAHQQNITQILVYLIQACHEFIPPEDLLPIIKNIAFHFITERSTDENITLGINTIREIIGRIPSILLEEDMKDFVQDLTMYTHKHKKFVMSAARSLINLVREHHPTLLHKSDRGKGTDLAKKPLNFGQQEVLDSRDLLKMGDEEDSEDEDDEGEWEEDGEEEINEDEDDEFEEVEQDEDNDEEGDDDDSGDWVDVDDDDEEIEVEDGDEEAKGDDDDDDEEEMEDVDEGDEDEEEEEEEDDDDDEEAPELVEMEDEKPKKSKKSKKSSSIRHRLDVNRILNDSDLKLFEHLKALRQQKRRRDVEEEDEGRDDNESDDESKSVDDDDDDEDRVQPDYVVDPSNLLPSGSSRLSKIERIQKVLSGRNETKYVKEAHAGGLTNKEKLRKKNFMMVRKGKRELLQKSRRGSGDVRADKAKN
jgi:protein SDA1